MSMPPPKKAAVKPAATAAVVAKKPATAAAPVKKAATAISAPVSPVKKTAAASPTAAAAAKPKPAAAAVKPATPATAVKPATPAAAVKPATPATTTKPLTPSASAKKLPTAKPVAAVSKPTATKSVSKSASAATLPTAKPSTPATSTKPAATAAAPKPAASPKAADKPTASPKLATKPLAGKPPLSPAVSPPKPAAKVLAKKSGAVAPVTPPAEAVPVTPAEAAEAAHQAAEKAFQQQLTLHSPRTREKLLAQHEVQERKDKVTRDAEVHRLEKEEADARAAAEKAAILQAQRAEAEAEEKRRTDEREAEEDRQTAAAMEKMLAARGIVRSEHPDELDREALNAERARKAEEKADTLKVAQEARSRRRSTMGDLDAITLALNKVTMQRANALLGIGGKSRHSSPGHSRAASQATSQATSKKVSRAPSPTFGTRPSSKKNSRAASPAAVTRTVHGTPPKRMQVRITEAPRGAGPSSSDELAPAFSLVHDEDLPKPRVVARRMSMPRMKSVLPVDGRQAAALAAADLLARGEGSKFMGELAEMNALLASAKAASSKVVSARGPRVSTALEEFQLEYAGKLAAAHVLLSNGVEAIDPATNQIVTSSALADAQTFLAEDARRTAAAAAGTL